MTTSQILLMMFKGTHIPIILHGLIIHQLLMKLSFCNFFSHKVQSFRQREVAVYLCSLKEKLSRIGHLCLSCQLCGRDKTRRRQEIWVSGTLPVVKTMGTPAASSRDNTSLYSFIKENSSC